MSMKKYKKCELREGDLNVIAIGEPEALFLEKAELVRDSGVRYPELLQVFWYDGTPWIFDRPLDKKQASIVLVEGFPYC